MKYPEVRTEAKNSAKKNKLYLLEIRLDGRNLPGKASVCTAGACSPKIAEQVQKLMSEWLSEQ